MPLSPIFVLYFHSFVWATSISCLFKGSGLAAKSTHDWFPHHDLHFHRLRATLENCLFAAHSEAQFVVKLQVRHVAGFEVAQTVFSVRFPGSVLDEGLRVAFASRARLSPNVDEIPAMGILLSERLVFGLVQEGKELIEKSEPAFSGESESERK